MTFFGREILVRTFYGVDKKRNPGFSSLCQTIIIFLLYHDAKTVWNSLELICFFFNWTFLGYVLGCWTFFGSGSSLKDFFWV